MTGDVSVREIHTTHGTVALSSHEVETALVRAAEDKLRGSGVSVPRQSPTSAKLRVKQLEEGSPSYPVEKWRAYVDLEWDHTTVPDAGPR